MKEYDDDRGALIEPGKIGKWLRGLDGDEFGDVKAAVAKEERRRSQKPPERMSDTEYASWVADQIRKADRAKKNGAARKAAND